jgi:serine phosphatase RsbU (regulator of sigma subunit)
MPRRRSTPSSPSAWRLILRALVTTACSWGIATIAGTRATAAVWLLACVSAAAWLWAVRFLLLETTSRRPWILFLVASAVGILISGPDPAGRRIAVILAVVFLLTRRRPAYRHLAGRQRASVFVAGLALLALLTFGMRTNALPGPEAAWLPGTGANVARYAIGALWCFWITTVTRLLFGIRLHSFRLRTKLAVSALLLALVPVVLVLILGILGIYGALGGREAVRGRAILQAWVAEVERGVALTPVPFAGEFRVTLSGEASESTPDSSTSPAWATSLAQALRDSPAAEQESAARRVSVRAAAGDEDTASIAASEMAEAEAQDAELRARLWAPADTTAYFVLEHGAWLLRLRGIGSHEVACTAYPLDGKALSQLAGILQCDAALYALEERVVAPERQRPYSVRVGNVRLGEGTDSTATSFALLGQGRYQKPGAAADSSHSFWRRLRAFGGEFVPVVALRDGRLTQEQMVLQLSTRLPNLIQGFMEQENELNRVIVFALMVLAVVFLVLESFALFLGIRITAGITGAVAALHQGTRRLAAGDLDARIDLPNQDEFGDLAASFNEMAVAVKHGREEAIARSLLEKEIETARAIQQRLLPREIPIVPGFDVTGVSISSRQVGGDYFDFLTLGHGHVGVAIGDVSGKGIPAALLMSNLQACLQGQVIHASGVDELVARINDLLARSTEAQMFATFFYGVLDSAQATFTYVNAGHILLGMLPGMPYEQATVELRPGDLLVLFTDGISEAEGPPARTACDGGQAEGGAESAEPEAEVLESDDTTNMFGEERLLEVIRTVATRPAAEVRDAILAAVTAHAAGVPQSDDITLVIIKCQTDGSR